MASYYILITVMCLFVIAVENRVIKSLNLNMPPEGITFEINIRPIPKRNHQHHNINSNKDINKSLYDIAKLNMENILREPVTPVPVLEQRYGVRVGKCPEGRKMVGGMCILDNDY